MTNKTTMLEKIQQTADFLRTKVADMPKIAVILGTGLGIAATSFSAI